MTARSTMADFRTLSPTTVEGLLRINDGIKQRGLDPMLVELIKLRVSQINGCAYCLFVHHAEARRLGMDEGRLQLLPAWRESPLFTASERAALAWAEAVTLIAAGPPLDSVLEDARRHFTDEELANLTGAVVAINGFNRIAVSYRFAHPVS